jgi:hypothetical protein
VTPGPPDGYVISFVHFHEHGLANPAHRFLWGLLHYYKIELQYLNPNEIQHMVAFVSLCEGFLGIEYGGNFHRQSIEEEGEGPAGPAYADGVRKHPYLEQLGRRVHVMSSSNKGWHKQWFYLKDDTTTPYWCSLDT